MSINIEQRKESLIKIIEYVSREFRLPSKISIENGRTIARVGKCTSDKDCNGTFDIEGLVLKYSAIREENIWTQTMYGMIKVLIGEDIEDKRDPDLMKNILTTFEKHPKYWVEKVPRPDRWFNGPPKNDGYLLGEIDGVKFIWSLGSQIKSILLKRSAFDDISKDEETILKHLEKRWEKDLEYHINEVRTFGANAIVGMKINNSYAINQDRLEKGPYLVRVFHGPRIFELMTYAPTCKAVLKFLNLPIEKLTVFGLTQDLVFIEETNKKGELKTNAWDRELLGRLVLDPVHFKRFEIYLEHKGTVFDLKNVKPLKIPLTTYNVNYYIPFPRNNTVYGKNGTTIYTP